MESIDCASLANQWQRITSEAAFQETLLNYWRLKVPEIFKSGELDNKQENESLKKNLLQPLEWFICNGEPGQMFHQLKQKSNPPQMCGKVFKSGESIYSCRECAMDPTCCLCVTCFQNSRHKNHRYRMTSSNGGGYCDCGDAEAWKKNVACDLHKLDSSQPNQDPLERLPLDMQQYTRALFSIIFRYCYNVLTMEVEGSIPEQWKHEKLEENFCTMLFNDEVHTYEQVIDTLKKAVSCSEKEAIGYATKVDREGRSQVRLGNQDKCQKAKSIIIKNTDKTGSKPLKVSVMHYAMVAHQTFALRLLEWLAEIIAISDGLRVILCQVALEPMDDDQSVTEKLILVDTKLWKGARIGWHQLFMGSLLMDLEYKKRLAALFTKHYREAQFDFIKDDHDHNVSIVSLSVQMYTVPSVARYLVAEHHLIKKIVDTFYDYYSQKHVKDGKLNFERGSNAGPRRLLYSITDLKYVLTCKPDEWDEPMKNGVIEGLESLLKLMQLIQDMNSVSRQTDHHIEIEPEWESAFHIQTRLEPCITLLLDWIGSDQSVLIRAFRIVMLKLRDAITTRKEVKMENKHVSGHNVLCIEYDISTQPVSIHIPITRFLAGLYIHLGKYNLNYYKEGLLPMGSLNLMELMEGPLRIQVLKAQCQVGLWRRNGYALLNQLYNYNSVRFQNETYDKDIIMLQTCAAILPPDQFLIAVLNRFDLIQCMGTQYNTQALSSDDVQARQRYVTLLKELLELLIIILCERYVVGVGEISDTDRIKREVIHQLCISPMTHSEINKSLPEDAQEETGAEDVVNLVGVFKKSGTTGKGIYELNENFLTSYNQYFYHYTRADKSRSEEHQRKARKNHKSIEVAAMVPPLPPPLCHNYSNMSRILECDVFVHILNTTIARTATSKFWSENSTHKALYLTGLALLEEERLHRESKNFQFSEKASEGNPSLEMNLQSLVGNQRIDVYKDLLEWVLKKFSVVSKLKGNSGTELPLEQESMDDSKEEEEKKTKAQLAQERRKRIMAQMSDMQRSFIKKNPSLFEDTNPLDSRKSSTTSMDVDVSDGPVLYAIALGSEQTPIPVSEPSQVTCMLCQEEEKISDNTPIMVLTACIQRSSVLSSTRGKKIADKDSFDPLLKSADRYWGTHVSSCGHVMHARCWQIYTDSLVTKENKRPVRFRNHLSFDLSKNEFLCPLCETVGNTVITLLPDLPVEKSKKKCDVSLEHLLSLIRDVLREDTELKEKAEITMDTATLSDETPAKQKKDDCKKPFIVKSNIGKSTISSEVWRLLSFNQQTNTKYSLPHPPVDRTEMLKTFSMSVYTVGLNVMPDDSNSRIPIMCWEAVAYTIQTAELYLRVEEKPLFCSLSSRQADCLNALVRLGAEGITVYNHQHVRKQLLRLLNVLVPISAKTSGSSILDVDMFTLLVSLCFSMPVLKETGGKDEVSSANLCADPITNKHIMTLALLAHVTQILLTCDLPEDAGCPVSEDMDDMYCREANCLQKVLRDLYVLSGVKRNVPSAFDLWSHVTTSCLPFLRCSALFFNSLAGVPFPAELKNIVFDEFGVLCRYLAVPANLASLFDTQLIPGVHTLLQIWCSHPLTRERLNNVETLIIRYPVQHNKLISLPHDYSDLMNQVASFVCPKSSGIQGESRAPAMCLVCGQVVCSQSYCCQTEVEEDTIGACMAHALECSSGVGMYLRVRECQLLLVSSKTRGCFHSPPYLDDYGESDVGLRRGNPLRLCKDLYHKLYILWLQHGIPAEVAHKLEANSNLLHIDWQNL